MFERFTKRAIKVKILAQEEARRLGYKTVGTEHLLLGLIREGSGIAAHTLKNEGVKLVVCRKKIEAITGRGSDFPNDLPDTEDKFNWAIHRARTGKSGDFPSQLQHQETSYPEPSKVVYYNFNEEANAAMKLASMFAEKGPGGIIDTEDLLVGILEMRDNSAIKALWQCDVDPVKICTELIAKTLELKVTSGVNKQELESKMAQFVRQIWEYGLIFLLLVTIGIYLLFPHLPGLVFSGTLVDAFKLALIIYLCEWVITPLLGVITALGLLSQFRLKLEEFNVKLLKQGGKKDHRSWKLKLAVRFSICFFISLAAFTIISKLDVSMLRINSLYASLYAAAIVAIIALVEDLFFLGRSRNKKA